MRAVLISLLLIITSKGVLASFASELKLRVENLSSVIVTEKLNSRRESILKTFEEHSNWDENYGSLNQVHRSEMLSFLRKYLKANDYYAIKVSGEITHFVNVEDLVDLFIYLGDKYNLDSRFVLAVHVSETSLINYTTINNPGNVGNNDQGVRKEFNSLEEGFEAMFISLSDFAEGKKWSFNGLSQNSLSKINSHLIKQNHSQAIFPAYYMSNANAPKTIIRLVRAMGWKDFNSETEFTIHSLT